MKPNSKVLLSSPQWKHNDVETILVLYFTVRESVQNYSNMHTSQGEDIFSLLKHATSCFSEAFCKPHLNLSQLMEFDQ